MKVANANRIFVPILILLLSSLLFSNVFAQQLPSTEKSEINWFFLCIGLFGGLALFLYGMEKMSDALKNVAGEKMKDILAMLSNNRIMGLITGAIVTAVIQSSSVTTVMLVGFVSANLMSLSQTIGVILGADIGTTITAQIVAFKVTKYALLFLAIGFAMLFISKKEKIQQYGYMVMGLGMIFFGMGVMSESMNPLRTYQPFIDLMANMSNPFLGILVATIFTALVQSSSAAMGVVIVLAMQGLITLEAGIALALGANIGTCVTAGLASIGKPREAVRVATSHVLFKILGVLIMLPLIGPFANIIVYISPSPSDSLTGIDAIASVLPRQVANAHTIFNIGIAILFLPFISQFARLVYWLVPDKPIGEEVEIQPKFLSEMLYHTPSLALDASRHEIKRMGKRVDLMNNVMMPAVLNGSKEDLLSIREMYLDIDILHKHLVTYLAKVSQLELNEQQTAKLTNIMAAVNDLDHIGDIIDVNMVDLGLRRIRKQFKISQATQKVINTLYIVVSDALKAAIRAVVEEDKEYAARVIAMKSDMEKLTKQAEQHQASRLLSKDSGKFEAYSVEIDIIDKLKRIYYHSKRIAKSVVELEQEISGEEKAA